MHFNANKIAPYTPGYRPFRMVDMAGFNATRTRNPDAEIEARESLRFHVVNLDTNQTVGYHDDRHTARKLSNALNAALEAFTGSGGLPGKKIVCHE